MRRYQRGFLNFITPAVATLASSVIGGAFGAKGARDQNRAQVAMSREQMDFQERMSSTAYQRAVSDMQAAGLNPMLAYSQGGASSPVGSMPQIQNVGAAAVSSASSAMGLMSSVQQMQQSRAQTEQIAAQTKKIESETMDQSLNVKIKERIAAKLLEETGLARSRMMTEAYRPAQLKAQTEKDVKEAERINTARQLLDLDLDVKGMTWEDDVKRRKAESKLSQLAVPFMESEAKFWDKADDMPQWIKMIFQLLQATSSARRAGR